MTEKTFWQKEKIHLFILSCIRLPHYNKATKQVKEQRKKQKENRQ